MRCRSAIALKIVSDITLFAANIVVGFTLSLCVLMVALGRDRQLLVWSLTFSLHAASYVLLALRGQIPDFISIVIANTAISATLALYIEGISRIGQMHPQRWPYWLPVVATSIVCWVFIDDFDSRVLIGSIFFAFQTGYLVFILFRVFRDHEGQGRWIMLGAVFVATAVLITRAVLSFVADRSLAEASGTSFEPMMTSLGAIAVLIMFAFGLIVVFKEKAEQKYMELAMRDPLTGLANRRMLENTLRRALRNSVRSKQIGAILLLDLDGFKPLNDSCGHGIGDQLLSEVAYRLKESVKGDDVVARMGGDEFVVSLSNLGSEPRLARDKTLLVAERILSEISRPYQCLNFSIDGLQNALQQCTCSIGVAFFGGDKVDQEKLLTDADLAMYKAKQLGGNGVVFAEDKV